MKKTAIFLLLLSTLFAAQSQDLYDWTDPVAVTDSVSLNANPFVWVHNNIAYMFYEKKADENSDTKIYCTELNGDNAEILLLDSDGTSFSKPAFVDHSYGNLVGYLTCIADLNGYNELFYFPYFNNDSVGDAVKLSEGDTVDQYAFTVGYYRLAMLCDSNIYAGDITFSNDSIQLANSAMIDSNNCYNIQAGNSEIAWEKHVNDSVAIRYSEFNYDTKGNLNGWTTPVNIRLTDQEPYLVIDKPTLVGPFNVLSWIQNDSIKGYYLDDQYFFDYDAFGLTALKSPASIFWFIAVKKFELYQPHYLCFEKGTDSLSEIYCSMGDYSSEDSARITNNQFKDSNPVLFGGEETWPYYSLFVYNIWQSYRNNNIVLYMSKSKAIIGSGIEESRQDPFHFKAAPNPFNSQVKLTFTLINNLPASCRIYSANGDLIETIQINNRTGGQQSLTWKPAFGLSKGIYYFNITQGKLSGTVKGIYQ